MVLGGAPPSPASAIPKDPLDMNLVRAHSTGASVLFVHCHFGNGEISPTSCVGILRSCRAARLAASRFNSSTSRRLCLPPAKMNKPGDLADELSERLGK
jgi:hypothetical protein